VNDRSPTKLLLCARDVLLGVMLPWSVSADQQEKIRSLRLKLEGAVSDDVDAHVVKQLLDEVVVVATQIADDTAGVRGIHDKMDCARLTLTCICARQV